MAYLQEEYTSSIVVIGSNSTPKLAPHCLLNLLQMHLPNLEAVTISTRRLIIQSILWRIGANKTTQSLYHA
jgi:hypothetical protein